MAKKNWTVEEAGIFCLETAVWDKESWNEGLWHEVEDQDSLDHFLRFLETSSSNIRIPYRHYDVATEAELKFYLDTWKKEEIRDLFPVLLLAFHGDEEGLEMPAGGKPVSTADLRAYLSEDDDRDNDAIIHFSSCYFAEPDKMKKLLEETGALSVSGYMKKENKGKGVGWYQSAAFELLFLAELFSSVCYGHKKVGVPDDSVPMRDFVRDKFAKGSALDILGREVGFTMWYDVKHGKIPKEKYPPYITPCKKEDF